VLFITTSLDGVRHDKGSVRQQRSLHGLAEILDQAPLVAAAFGKMAWIRADAQRFWLVVC
jgi:hypothetical protein